MADKRKNKSAMEEVADRLANRESKTADERQRELHHEKEHGRRARKQTDPFPAMSAVLRGERPEKIPKARKDDTDSQE